MSKKCATPGCGLAVKRLGRCYRHCKRQDVQPIPCGSCESHFVPRAATALYCSPECRQAQKYKYRTPPTSAKKVAQACATCAHWAGGSTGCRLERFRYCYAGITPRLWAEKPANQHGQTV